MPQFALAPALVDNGIIDYATPEGVKLYKSATQALPKEFDCRIEGLKIFLSQLKDRAREYGWTPILEIPIDAAQPHANLRSLLTEYGRISLQQVQEHAETYVLANSRAAQDSMQLYQCIMKSLTEKGVSRIMLRSEDYTIGDIPSGACLLKVIIREAYIDTNATLSTIRTRLSSLDVYMREVNSDIEKFNLYVIGLVDSLAARGETSTDLLTNLFKGYKAATDKKFVSYIERKEIDFFDGQDLPVPMLMDLALNKAKIQIEMGEWMATTEEEEKIIALEAQVQNLKKSVSEVKKKKTAQNDGKEKPKKDRKKNEKPAWMLVPPKSNESNKKHVNKKDYWWCPNHKSWVRHHPNECKGQGVKPDKGKGKDEEKKTNEDSKQLKISAALAAIAEAEEDSD